MRRGRKQRPRLTRRTYDRARAGNAGSNASSTRHFHGEIIAVTTLTMICLQQNLRGKIPQNFSFAPFPYTTIENKVGHDIAELWQKEYAKKCVQPIQPLAQEYVMPTDLVRIQDVVLMEQLLKAVGCSTSHEEIGISKEVYDMAVSLAAFSRNRFTWLDIAASIN